MHSVPPSIASEHWLFQGNEREGPLAAGILLALRAGRDAAASLRRHVWFEALAGESPVAWLDVGLARSPKERFALLSDVPRKAWPVIGHAADWMSAWSWAEAWHQKLNRAWVVIESEDDALYARKDALMPIAAPPGLSNQRERRLRRILRAQAGRIVALSAC